MTATETTLLRAARAVDARTITDDAWILIDGDTIRAVGSGPDAPAADRSPHGSEVNREITPTRAEWQTPGPKARDALSPHLPQKRIRA